MIRFARREDGPALLRVYAQYIDTAVSFEYALPTEEEFLLRIENIQASYPYLVCEEEGRIVGYAYAHRYQTRDAYQWNAELSVYIDRAYTSRGLGRRLYQTILEMLKLQGVKTVYGIVTMPNEKSEKLHLSMGFARIGTYHKTGYKCGQWHDVALFEKSIGTYEADPHPFLPIRQVEEEKLAAILRAQA